jgi:aspartate/tyrosine/aromatic aminotransferase
MAGYPPFIAASRKFLWTDSVLEAIGDRIATVQTSAYTGALFLVSRITKRFLDVPRVFISDPFWSSYIPIFQENAHTIAHYPYLKGWEFNCDGTLAALDSAPDGCLVVLQVCGHNPTGLDPTREQWLRLFECCARKRHLICFDFAYIGFGSGAMATDAWPVRHRATTEVEFFVAFSFSKCVILYGERIGSFHVVCKDNAVTETIHGQLVRIGRGTWSMRPQNGSYIATEILNALSM